MAVFNAIERSEVKREGSDGGYKWYVLHPTNGAILAYCDTEIEACEFANALKAINVEKSLSKRG